MINKIKIDKGKCINCGSCTITHPDNFKLEYGKIVIINDKIDNTDVINMCPVGAISIK